MPSSARRPLGTIRAAPAASPRRVLGRSARHPRRRRDASSDDPRGSRGVAATRDAASTRRSEAGLRISWCPAQVKTSLERVDVDVRKDLLLNVLLSGGGSCFQGASERLYADVSLSLCSPFKVKVVAPSAFERKFAVWIGGSILTSLGSFQQMWLSRRQYEDDGPARLVEGRWD